jgi:hypothetical protein
MGCFCDPEWRRQLEPRIDHRDRRRRAEHRGTRKTYRRTERALGVIVVPGGHRTRTLNVRTAEAVCDGPFGKIVSAGARIGMRVRLRERQYGLHRKGEQGNDTERVAMSQDAHALSGRDGAR